MRRRKKRAVKKGKTKACKFFSTEETSEVRTVEESELTFDEFPWSRREFPTSIYSWGVPGSSSEPLVLPSAYSPIPDPVSTFRMYETHLPYQPVERSTGGNWYSNYNWSIELEPKTKVKITMRRKTPDECKKIDSDRDTE